MVTVMGRNLIRAIGSKYDVLVKEVMDIKNGVCSVLGVSDVARSKESLMSLLENYKESNLVTEDCVNQFRKHLSHSFEIFSPWTKAQLNRAIFSGHENEA